MIPIEQWQWKGLPGHFILGDRCLFHLHTIVGKYKISSVGALYRNDIKGNRIFPMDTIGHERHYEIMVYDLSELINEWCEIDFEGFYFDKHKDATEEDCLEMDKIVERAHFKMCMKYAERGESE